MDWSWCIIVFLAVFGVVFTPVLTVHRGTQTNRVNLISTLLETYDKRIPPNFEQDEAIVVKCQVYLDQVDSISIESMEFHTSLFIRQRWNDPRLAYSQHRSHMNTSMLTLDTRMADEIWTPDIIFAGEKTGRIHDITIPNKLVRVYRNGDVLYSIRLSLTLSCPMNLRKFPFDTQTCSLDFESFGYTKDRLNLMWIEDDPFTINHSSEMAEFSLMDIVLGRCDRNYTTGIFPCLEAKAVLKRQFGFYLIQTYVPSGLIVVLSWISFWINPDAVPGRVTLGVSTVLTITTQNAGERRGLLHVSYIRAIDVWMAMCMILVFGALVEYAFVNVQSRTPEERARKNSRAVDEEEMVVLTTQETGQNGNSQTGTHKTRVKTRRWPGYKETLKRALRLDTIDRKARLLFPLVFGVFNIIYWAAVFIS